MYLIIHTMKNKQLSKRIYNLDLIANFSFFNKTWETWLFPSKHFNVASTLSFGWCDVAMSRRGTTSNQHWINIVYVVYFNVDMNNVRKRQNNVVIFNVEFYNISKRRNNVVNITASKKNKKIYRKIHIEKIQIEYPEFKVLTTIS